MTHISKKKSWWHETPEMLYPDYIPKSHCNPQPVAKSHRLFSETDPILFCKMSDFYDASGYFYWEFIDVSVTIWHLCTAFCPLVNNKKKKVCGLKLYIINVKYHGRFAIFTTAFFWMTWDKQHINHFINMFFTHLDLINSLYHLLQMWLNFPVAAGSGMFKTQRELQKMGQ